MPAGQESLSPVAERAGRRRPSKDSVRSYESHHSMHSMSSIPSRNPIKYSLLNAVVWTAVAVFGMASLALFCIWMALPHARSSITATFLVVTMAFACYFAKANGMGDISLFGSSVPIVRYIDWISTTPLMLYELSHIGGAETYVVIMIIGCDLLMLAFGIVAAVLPRHLQWSKWLWFFGSGFCYVSMLVTLHMCVARGTVLAAAEDVQWLFLRLEILTIAVWSCYPVVVGLGRAHMRFIGKFTEDALLVTLDCISKIGMELLIVSVCAAEDSTCHAHSDHDSYSMH